MFSANEKCSFDLNLWSYIAFPFRAFSTPLGALSSVQIQSGWKQRNLVHFMRFHNACFPHANHVCGEFDVVVSLRWYDWFFGNRLITTRQLKSRFYSHKIARNAIYLAQFENGSFSFRKTTVFKLCNYSYSLTKLLFVSSWHGRKFCDLSFNTTPFPQQFRGYDRRASQPHPRITVVL